MILPVFPSPPVSSLQPDWLPVGITAHMLRLDQLHSTVSGNKWYKLKYNLEAALAEGRDTLLTFGGAWSNHLAATAAACNMLGMRSIGVVRGERPPNLSITLQQVEANGMELVFISREEYRHATTAQWAIRYPNAFVIPEGGGNAWGVRGCEDILSGVPAHASYSHIMCAGGTGTTLAGLINSAGTHQEVIGIPVLKNAGWMQAAIAALLREDTDLPRWQLFRDFHGGGYAKTTTALIAFINNFYTQTGIPLDIIYTGKMVMAFQELALGGHFAAGSRVLLVHTGGLQGNLSLAPGVLTYQ
ncbi:1-aminocyclopropane-1-carboxylate deaminase [Chitinophaga costaii]|uniref:1-aminocyclopropane-1-carboxylate deaminase n=1 Tax=Chitinophaga costaii TaxID=1335309 RepID=A0A1C3ZEK8_9BACT|nr:pyridoxal-phosphate dependent enzyme [Chitinophaga costaii]PUZ30339.1 1-aminocyclopropane-1-carboxylate deaminase [Chitinophaga costaii]SCB80758.1 1-aminocyclopropane-1-carboxylate deaminase [Chitinophaga costaii]